jgi:ABC-type nitrate/sulfonate/bicarbonate transport system substrate-binding protein
MTRSVFRSRFALVAFGVILTGAATLGLGLDAVPRASADAAGGVLEVPYILWGGDVATFYANGGLDTKPGSLFDKQGLKLHLTPGDDFTAQVKNYLAGKSPFLRGTMSMLGQASEKLAQDPGARPVVFLQLTWSAGDHLVSRGGLRTLGDLKGKKVALQRGGPHVGMLQDILHTARLTWQDVTPAWTDDVTGPKGPAELFRKDAAVDACFAISPDMMALTGDLDKAGSGAGGTVKDAHVLVSTMHMKRSIADVYACRKDYYDAHRDVVEKFAAAYLRGCEELVDLRRRAKGGNDKEASEKYQGLLRLTQQIYGKEAIAKEEDADGLVGDAVFVGLPGNRSFFTDKGNLSNFEGKQKAALDVAVALGDARERHEFLKADLDYDKLKQLGGLEDNPPPQSQFRDNVEALDKNVIYSFTISFAPSQMEFDEVKYAEDFQRALEQASLFGNSVVEIRGHSDPTELLLEFIKAGTAKGSLTRVGTSPNDYEYFWKRKPLKLTETTKVAELIQGTDFDGAAVDPRETLKELQELSGKRAKAVMSALATHAKLFGIRLDPGQFKTRAVGVFEPVVPKPRNEEQMARNRRVEFRLMKVAPEARVPSAINY